MFKKFTVEENVSSISQMKNSVQRGILTSIITQYPSIESEIENILPKKQLTIGRGSDGIQLLIANNEIKFYNIRDGPFMPTLKVLHQYPNMMQRMQVDKGAIRFILGGANIMCPGFTSPGGSIPNPIEIDQPVAIYCENKVHAVAIGITKMSSEDIKKINKGMAVESIHYLLDDLWQIKTI